jgi:hypothetical protein
MDWYSFFGETAAHSIRRGEGGRILGEDLEGILAHGDDGGGRLAGGFDAVGADVSEIGRVELGVALNWRYQVPAEGKWMT